jgi:hypothetical protein
MVSATLITEGNSARLAGLVHRNHPGMLQPRGEPGFLREARLRFSAATMEPLDRHPSIQTRVPRLQHLPQPTATDLPGDQVRAMLDHVGEWRPGGPWLARLALGERTRDLAGRGAAGAFRSGHPPPAAKAE